MIVLIVFRWCELINCLLQVDERAVLKHFEWPEQKADALREAAFGYCDLKKLESEASSFRDIARQPCRSALKKMQALFEKYFTLNEPIILFVPFIWKSRNAFLFCFVFLVLLTIVVLETDWSMVFTASLE